MIEATSRLTRAATTGTGFLIAAIWAVVVVLVLLNLIVMAPFTVDDAFITFRYARNWVDHGVWNWNLTGSRVESYTNALYAFLAVVPAALGLPVPIFFKLIGIAALVAMGVRVARIFRLDPMGQALLALFMATALFLPSHAVSGLETRVYMLLCVVVITRFDRSQPVSSAIDPMLLVALPFTRPEGAVLSAVLFLRMVIHARRISASVWLATAVAILCGLAYMAWRTWYFGELLPNTFYVKTGASGWLARVPSNLGLTLPLALLGGLAVAFLVARRSPMAWPALAQLAIFALLYLPSDLQMNYLQRFAIQSLFPIALAALGWMLQNVQDGGRGRLMIEALVLGIVGSNLWYFSTHSVNEIALYMRYTPAQFESTLAVARRLAGLRERGYTMALSDAGLMPYETGWTTIDAIGLASREIARLPEQERSRWLRDNRPDVVLTYATQPGRCDSLTMSKSVLGEIVGLAREQGYVCVRGPRVGQAFYMDAYVNPANPDFKTIAKAFADAADAVDPNAGSIRAILARWPRFLTEIR